MNSNTTTTSDGTRRLPEKVGGDPDEQPDPRHVTPEVEDRDPEEAGYGYGV